MPADSLLEQNETLRRLAEALDMEPTAFHDDSVSDLSQTMELLRLWQGVTDQQDRAKVLAMVKAITHTFASRA
ncbi:hypothetical protein FV226_23540 [Methylobacterium sp. WL12]|uniref:hypothetical protein n=1 Tax=Methylobacterium sp. WL12 TaxID=2603890 RepID=UPI0011CB9F94|nr:hypothetical protein [Methylobacterium sp. WL12]TXM66466.1 hypothetical protein FV226_23540 [Methylobacterium sp. WL12]